MSDVEFEDRIARALKAPVATSGRAREAIMQRVRRASQEDRHRGVLSIPSARAVRHSIIGLAMAAGIGSITTLSALRTAHGGARATGAVTSVVIGDSVVEGFRDTLRLVRMIFDDTAARHVAVVGDFNAWNPDASRMQRDGRTGRWSVTLALRDGDHRYAVVVDDTRWVGSSRGGANADARPHALSLLHVTRATN